MNTYRFKYRGWRITVTAESLQKARQLFDACKHGIKHESRIA